MAGRKIRDEQDARTCLAAAKTSGASRLEWEKQHGVDGRSLFAWDMNLRRGVQRRSKPRAAPMTQGGLIELIPGSIIAERRYLIRCGQLTVEVDDHFEEAPLSRLLRVLLAC